MKKCDRFEKMCWMDVQALGRDTFKGKMPCAKTTYVIHNFQLKTLSRCQAANRVLVGVFNWLIDKN